MNIKKIKKTKRLTYPSENFVNVVKLLCFIAQLLSYVTANEDAFEVDPFSLRF